MKTFFQQVTDVATEAAAKAEEAAKLTADAIAENSKQVRDAAAEAATKAEEAAKLATDAIAENSKQVRDAAAEAAAKAEEAAKLTADAIAENSKQVTDAAAEAAAEVEEAAKEKADVISGGLATSERVGSIAPESNADRNSRYFWDLKVAALDFDAPEAKDIPMPQERRRRRGSRKREEKPIVTIGDVLSGSAPQHDPNSETILFSGSRPGNKYEGLNLPFEISWKREMKDKSYLSSHLYRNEDNA